MKNVFITGGSGFVGGHLIARLRSIPSVESITVYDRNPRPEKLATSVKYAEGDIRDMAKLIFSMRGCDTVFHLAANADIAKAVSDPDIDFTDGTQLTRNVLEAMRATDTKRLIYFSGSGVYGDDKFRAWSEMDAGSPISPYGASKLASEAMISAYSHMFGLTARAFRFANLVGGGQTHGVGYAFLRKMHTQGFIDMLGDGSQTKSYIWIQDALDAVFTVMAQSTDGFDVFNVASEDAMSVDDIGDMVQTFFLPSPGRVHVRSGTGEPRGWKGDVPVIKLDCAKIHSTGWKPKWNSHQAMRAALEDMKKELSL